jgi:Cdc6-like AAA superfamily ATPase
MMTSLVISHLQNHFHLHTDVGIAYIFCDFYRQDIQTPTALIANLLRQLSRGQHSGPTRGLYKTKKNGQDYPSRAELLVTIHNTMASYSRVILIVDALDEIDTLESRGTFLRELFRLQKVDGICVSFFATSRHGMLIESSFMNSLKKIIRADEADVRKYLDGRLEQFQPWVVREGSLIREIKETISKATDGM